VFITDNAKLPGNRLFIIVHSVSLNPWNDIQKSQHSRVHPDKVPKHKLKYVVGLQWFYAILWQQKKNENNWVKNA